MSVRDAVNSKLHLREWLLVHYGSAVDIDDEWQLAALTLQALDDSSLTRDEYYLLMSERTGTHSQPGQESEHDHSRRSD